MDFRRIIANKITKPLMPAISKTGLTPDTLTWIGLIINITAAAMIALGHLLIGGLLVLFSGLFDILDGALARYINKTTKFGALLDSTLDRLSEGILLFGLLVYNIIGANVLELYLIFGVLIGSFLVSYIRARAEGLGIECKVGLFTRTERVILLALGLIFSFIPYVLVVILMILALFSFVTVVQRLVHVYIHTRKQEL
jgi:CDP-diacylglycerol--glycerol-3-phosphate 3-phosphatidyltransferase